MELFDIAFYCVAPEDDAKDAAHSHEDEIRDRVNLRGRKYLERNKGVVTVACEEQLLVQILFPRQRAPHLDKRDGDASEESGDEKKKFPAVDITERPDQRR